MDNTVVDRQNQTELLVDAQSTYDLVKELKINSHAMYKLAAEQLQEVKGGIKDLTERRLDRTRKLDELKKLIMDDYRPALSKLEEAKTFLECGMLLYNREQESIRREEQARLESVARAERERLEKEAAKLEKKGKNEEAEAARLTAQVITAAPVTVEAPKSTGTSVRKTWKARVTDKAAFFKFIADHPEYIDLGDVNDSALNAIARAQKQNMKIAGAESYEESGITSRKNPF